MAWHVVMDSDTISLTWDDKADEAILEVNDGGIVPNYVTIRLGEAEVDRLIASLSQIKQRLLDAKRQS